ncbi:acyl-CoA N-acyltransferase [Peniophora sp. CONT]|nr:acyl-CoA N-acyltransferase [Peniophora sp. CONT]
MTFQTERTILRAYEPADADKILEHWNSLEIQDLAFIDYAAPRTKKFIEKTAESVQSNDGLFIMITDKANGQFIGQFSLTMQQRKNRIGHVGLSFVEAYRGKGYGKEILTWVIQHGFKNCGLHRIALGTVEHNTAARALYKSVGFVEEGIEREANWVGGQWRGMVSFGILEYEWDIEKGGKRE